MDSQEIREVKATILEIEGLDPLQKSILVALWGVEKFEVLGEYSDDRSSRTDDNGVASNVFEIARKISSLKEPKVSWKDVDPVLPKLAEAGYLLRGEDIGTTELRIDNNGEFYSLKRIPFLALNIIAGDTGDESLLNFINESGKPAGAD